jgi:hypothetical protein
MAREIRYTPRWQIAFGFVLWAVLTGGFAYFSAEHLYEDYCFTHHAVPVTGTVVQKYYTVSHGGKGGTSYAYHLSYNYTAGNLRGFCEQTVLYATYCTFAEGGTLPVMYLPENPAKVRLNLLNEEHAIHTETGILCAVTGFFFFGGALILWRVCTTNATCLRLQQTGLVTQGVVTNIGIDYVGKARTPRSYLQIEYRDGTGATLQGKSLYLTKEQESQWRPGDGLQVLYDRGRPQCFMIDLNSDRRDRPGAAGNPSSRA